MADLLFLLHIRIFFLEMNKLLANFASQKFTMVFLFYEKIDQELSEDQVAQC